MPRNANLDWNLPNETSWESVQTAILMDLRDELHKLNGLLNCSEFVGIPRVLQRIARNTTPKKRLKKKGASLAT